MGGGLGAKPLYKLRTMNRLNMFITSIVFSLLFLLCLNENALAQDLSLDTVYVISEKFTPESYNRKNAREDIANGYVFLFKRGWFGVVKEVDSLSSYKYGFKIQAEGCSVVVGREYYNDEVMIYLNKINGEGWWKKFLKESKLEEDIISLP